MAADVVFTAESPRYTNPCSWNQITEYALRDLDEPARREYQGYADVPGADFPLLPDAKAAEVARWLSGVTGRMLAAGKTGASKADRAHAEELPRKLHSEIQLRDRRRPGLK